MRIVTLAAVNDSLNLVYSPGFYINLVDEVNRALEPLFLEFRQMMNEDDGQPVCAIVSLRKNLLFGKYNMTNYRCGAREDQRKRG